MFAMFRSDPVKKLRKAYYAKLEKAMLAQRSGDITSYSFLTAEAEELWAEIQKLESAAQK
jgi:hypothetical protein